MKADQQARFRDVYESHYGSVLAYALRRIDPAAAEDIAAETFLISWRRFEALPEDPLPWLLTVARNLLANHRRGSVRRDVALSRLRSESTPVHRDVADQIAARAEVLDAFQRLSERDQEALALVAWEGLTSDRAAQVLGCSVGAFWVRLHRARRRLARELDGNTRVPGERPARVEPNVEVEPG